MSDPSNKISVNPDYIFSQLTKAFTTHQTHKDPEVRVQAQKKVDSWIKVVQNLLSGSLQVGSRTPVSGTPGWVTLEVVTGGFATGEFLAAGPLQSHEINLLARLLPIDKGMERTGLNTYYLSDEGLGELQHLLASGCYRINVPEEGALLVVAWLLKQGYTDQARTILDEIGPYLSKLRFYPVSDSRPFVLTPMVSVQNVGQIIRGLKTLRTPEAIEKQKEATLIWAPLYDRVVELFLQTISGPIPILQKGPDGQLLKNKAGLFLVEGGWPCQHYPNGWQEQARVVLEDYARLRVHHQRCTKPDRKEENFARLRAYLQVCIEDPGQLTGKDVAAIRTILAAIVTKRGVPNSPQCQQFRAAQINLIDHPTKEELAQILIQHLAGLPPDEALDSLDSVLHLIAPKEMDHSTRQANPVLLKKLGNSLLRCLNAPVEILVEKGVISSGEVLARVIPQLTSQIRAAGIPDRELQRLYTAIYIAFRRRRSLLLLNLEHQVKLEELPWVKVIDAHRENTLYSQEQARDTLEQVVCLAITAFPHQILPNKLLQELRSLAGSAGLHIPLVDEIAADIFMGDFSEKYLQAAQQAGELLQGTLYERYYGISYPRVRQIDDIETSGYGARTSPLFAALCREMAGNAPSTKRWSVAHNGKIIEQEQILTTHNLATLVSRLGLIEKLNPHLEELARRCFEWICHRHQQKISLWNAQLQMIKNTAYAWRQTVFFLALLPEDAQTGFLTWAYTHLESQRPAYQTCFKPALDGLALAIQKSEPEARSRQNLSNPAHRFLGWTTERHWLMDGM
ncbi:MAG: hypothetical protein HY774_09060 [Acidobacteria bacterium]|nr:hypothetical protein [Acidobacteriota bacterium]